MKKIQWLKCVACNWEWRARIMKPKSCPRCKRYDWEESKLKGKNQNESRIQ